MKTTKKEYFTTIKGIIEDTTVENKEEILNFINHEIELLNRKSVKSEQTKTQKENIKIKENIAEILTDFNKPVTVSEIIAVNGLSNQKVSALLRQMVKDGKVERTEEKKKAYFSLV